eukprot:scaffold2983_cov123-Cylindrotheca_fusiformis.AAC.5
MRTLLSVALSSCFAINVISFPSTTNTKKSLFADLQKSFTPESILQNIGTHVETQADPQGSLSSLILVRLSKQLISLDNNGEYCGDIAMDTSVIKNVVHTLATSDWDHSPQSRESAVDGTKAAAVLARLLPDVDTETWKPLLEMWEDPGIDPLETHQLSGIKWSFDVLGQTCNLPTHIQEAYESLDLPFRIHPKLCCNLSDLSVPNLVKEVNFRVDDIRTKSRQIVKERRQTAWQGDDHVAPFAYSGKSMPRDPWSSVVLNARDQIKMATGQHYDGCLLNLYPDGGSGMRYHIDPDQGTLWAYETAVVSVGSK